MAKSTSTSAPSKTKTHTIARIVSPLTTLSSLDGYMCAAGYDVAHPWRAEIATALAASGNVDSSIDHAIDAVNAADLGVNQEVDAAPLHRPFSWLHHSLCGKPHAEFLALTRNICKGAALIGEIVQMDGMDRDSGQATLFSANDAETLELMAANSLRMLADEAEREIEFLNDRAMAEVKV